MTFFAFISISLLPEDVHWFADVTLDRLLLHPSVFLTLSAFLMLHAKKTEHENTP